MTNSPCKFCFSKEKLIFELDTTNCERDIGIRNIEQCKKCKHSIDLTTLDTEQYQGQGGANSYILNNKDDILYAIKMRTFWLSSLLQEANINDDDIKTLTYLDFGCGNGINIHSGLRLFKSAYGSDFDIKYFLHINKCLEVPELNNLIYGDVSDIQEQFDIISAFHVLEHFSNEDEFFIIIKKLLKKNGILICEVPTLTSDGYAPNHYNYFTVESLISVLKKYNFSIINYTVSNRNFINIKAKLIENIS